jgi:ribosome hibernation promoting factor
MEGSELLIRSTPETDGAVQEARLAFLAGIQIQETTMQLSVTGHHIDVTDALRAYVVNKIEKIERHFDLVSDVHCILKVEKLRHTAEATVNVNGGKLFADATEEDMYAAIDGLVDKLDRQVRKYKEKLGDHHARDANKRSFE